MKSIVDEMVSLQGQAVLISGGTTGIGRTLALRLLQDGARVMVFGRHDQELQDALADMRALGKGEVYGLVADQARTEDVKRVYEEADRVFGGLDILVNNAAISAASAASTPLEDIRYVIETNVIGLIQMTQQAVQRFNKKGRGQIVNVGSLSDTAREAGSDIYVATKAAVNGFSESIRKELGEKGVRVILIEPGLVGSDMASESTPPEEQPEKIEKGTMLKAEDIAESIRFALMQPERCDIIQMQIRPHKQTEI